MPSLHRASTNAPILHTPDPPPVIPHHPTPHTLLTHTHQSPQPTPHTHTPDFCIIKMFMQVHDFICQLIFLSTVCPRVLRWLKWQLMASQAVSMWWYNIGETKLLAGLLEDGGYDGVVALVDPREQVVGSLVVQSSCEHSPEPTVCVVLCGRHLHLCPAWINETQPLANTASRTCTCAVFSTHQS